VATPVSSSKAPGKILKSGNYPTIDCLAMFIERLGDCFSFYINGIGFEFWSEANNLEKEVLSFP
jgi:hypothetical protein